MQRGALIQHDRDPKIVECLRNVKLEYIDPQTLDGPQCVDLMLGGNYDFVLPCLTLHSYLAFRLAEVAHAANLTTRVIMYTAWPDPCMLRMFDGVMSKPFDQRDVRVFTETMAHPVRRHRSRLDVDRALEDALSAAYLVQVVDDAEWESPTLSVYREYQPPLPWRALAELAQIHARQKHVA
jgi:hypothetical protein